MIQSAPFGEPHCKANLVSLIHELQPLRLGLVGLTAASKSRQNQRQREQLNESCEHLQEFIAMIQVGSARTSSIADLADMPDLCALTSAARNCDIQTPLGNRVAAHYLRFDSPGEARLPSNLVPNKGRIGIA